jgi:hypothetical protein
MCFLRRFDDYVPVTWTALAHIPSKEIWILPQAIVDLEAITHTDSLGSLDLGNDIEQTSGTDTVGDASKSHSGSLADPVETKPDCFGMYRIYARKPLQDPLVC